MNMNNEYGNGNYLQESYKNINKNIHSYYGHTQ